MIIPTRDRAETLPYTLRTALNQRSRRLEVIVSDNFSQDNTAAVVRSFSDPRLRLINPGRRLSMSDHWDYALLQAAGDYVLFIGDDDGIVPGALDKLEASILATHRLVYSWPRPIYRWPIDNDSAHTVFLPPVGQASEINLENIAKFAISMGGWRWARTPSMYHSAVAERIPATIREQTGRVFHSTQPDVFMAMAVPVFAKMSAELDYYVSVLGQSQKSNSGTSGRPNRAAYLEKFLEEYGGYKIHPTLFPGIPIALNLTPDSLLVAMEKFAGFYAGMKFNYDAMWAQILRENSGAYKYPLTSMDVISKRRQIRSYHPFNVRRFLLYSAFQQSLELRRRLRTRMSTSRRLAKGPPDNILDFVARFSDPVQPAWPG